MEIRNIRVILPDEFPEARRQGHKYVGELSMTPQDFPESLRYITGATKAQVQSRALRFQQTITKVDRDIHRQVTAVMKKSGLKSPRDAEREAEKVWDKAEEKLLKKVRAREFAKLKP